MERAAIFTEVLLERMKAVMISWQEISAADSSMFTCTLLYK